MIPIIGKCLLLEAVSRDRVEKRDEKANQASLVSRKIRNGKKGYQQGPMWHGFCGACKLR